MHVLVCGDVPSGALLLACSQSDLESLANQDLSLVVTLYEFGSRPKDASLVVTARDSFQSLTEQISQLFEGAVSADQMHLCRVSDVWWEKMLPPPLTIPLLQLPVFVPEWTPVFLLVSSLFLGSPNSGRPLACCRLSPLIPMSAFSWPESLPEID